VKFSSPARQKRGDMMTQQVTKILVLGGGYAGVMAALRLAGKTRRLGTEITLVNG
jgi:NADH dehydrogenase FAD-containing subunit